LWNLLARFAQICRISARVEFDFNVSNLLEGTLLPYLCCGAGRVDEVMKTGLSGTAKIGSGRAAEAVVVVVVVDSTGRKDPKD
jgi:hypothetical protein